MELGALVCKPQQPRCGVCPLSRLCQAKASGDAQELPRLPGRKRSVEVLTEVCLLRSGELVLGYPAPADGINAGFLELPGLGLPTPEREPDGTAEPLLDRLGLWVTGRITLSEVRFQVQHAITNHRITVAVREASGEDLALRHGVRFAHPDDQTTPWSTVARKVFRSSRQQTKGWLPFPPSGTRTRKPPKD
jgi:adenine-specific DNA glycosylase